MLMQMRAVLQEQKQELADEHMAGDSSDEEEKKEDQPG